MTLVKVPRIFWPYSSKRVLTMEWIDGIKLTDRAGLRRANLDVQYIVDLVRGDGGSSLTLPGEAAGTW